jgi:hypothetical protein
MVVVIVVIYVAGGFLFLGSLAAHIYVRVRLRPREGSDIDHYHYEFEDQHPDYARYTKWLRLTMAGAAAGVLLLFLGVVF